MDLLLRRRLMIAGSEEGGGSLPAGYTAYDWIKCNAWRDGSYIDTLIPNQNGGVAYETKVKVTVYNPSQAFIIGSSGWLNNLWFNTDSSIAFVNKTNQYLSYGNITYNGIYEISCDEDNLLVNGVSGTANNDSGNNAQGNIWFLCGNGSRNIDFPVYYCRIYINGHLVRNLVPCTDPLNVPGVYDFVSRTFFSNAGTGSLVVGND